MQEPNVSTPVHDDLLFRPRTDRVTFEVLRHRLWQINDEQGLTVLNVSGSPVASEANDFNTAIADAEGSLLVVGPYILAHMSAITLVIKNVLQTFPPDEIGEGDMFLTNDPWLGAVHQNDVCVVSPVHWQGRLVAWTASTVHEVDVGGNEPGSWNPRAVDAFQEAPRYRLLRIMRQGQLQREVMDTYLTNSRTRGSAELDLRAQIAAGNVAKSRLLDLFERYSVETVMDVMQDILHYSEVLLRRKLAEMPDGEWYAEDYLDHDGHESRVYRVRLTLTKKGDELTFDYRGSDPQTPGFVNCPYSGVLAAVFTAIVTHLCSDIPWNAGVLRVLKVLVDEGTMHNARYPAPVSGGIVNASWTTQNTACTTLSKMLSCSEKHKTSLMAQWTGSSFAYNIFGTNQHGQPFGTMMLSSTLGGAGARYFADGHDNAGPLTSPRPSVVNVESAEALFPFLYVYRKRAKDSGGPGKFRGGVSAESALVPYGVDYLRVFISTQGSDHSSGVGLDGGYPGGGSNALLRTNTDIWTRIAQGRFPERFGDLSGSFECLPPKHILFLRSDDVLNTVGHGGGGFDDPLEREPQYVQRDVQEGYVSSQRARDTYGVVLDAAAQRVLLKRTEKLRQKIRLQRLTAGQMPETGAGVRDRGDREASTARIGESLYVGEGRTYCSHCHHFIAEASENPKQHCVVIQSPLGKAGPWLSMRWRGNSERFELREYVCPGCGALLFVDERLKSEKDHWNDYRVSVT